VIKPLAPQIQAILEISQPLFVKIGNAQARAHSGIPSSWAETREAVKPVATAMMVVAFILNILSY